MRLPSGRAGASPKDLSHVLSARPRVEGRACCEGGGGGGGGGDRVLSARLLVQEVKLAGAGAGGMGGGGRCRWTVYRGGVRSGGGLQSSNYGALQYAANQ